MAEESVSAKVQALYREYPYPPREPGTGTDPYIDYVLGFSALALERPAAYLDAGCGTGSSVIGAALFQPDLQVYGCDFNAESLRSVQRDVDDLGLTNVTLRQVDLLELPRDFGPAEGFDVIFCTGVIHHTPDPLGILKGLSARLAPQGVLRLMVYAAKGRENLYRFADVAGELFPAGELSLEQRIEQTRELLQELHERGEVEGFQPPALRGPLEGSHLVEPAELADRYLHPHDTPYTLRLLREHIEAAGLTFLRWFEERSWDLDELLPHAAGRGDFPDDRWERFEIVEELFDRDQYDLYLVGPEFVPERRDFTLDQPLRTNPQVHLTETTFRGLPAGQEARLLFYPAESLSLHQARLLRALGARTATLRELLDEWGEGVSEEWLRAAISLLYRDYLYRPK